MSFTLLTGNGVITITDLAMTPFSGNAITEGDCTAEVAFFKDLTELSPNGVELNGAWHAIVTVTARTRSGAMAVRYIHASVRRKNGEVCILDRKTTYEFTEPELDDIHVRIRPAGHGFAVFVKGVKEKEIAWAVTGIVQVNNLR